MDDHIVRAYRAGARWMARNTSAERQLDGYCTLEGPSNEELEASARAYARAKEKDASNVGE